MVAHQTSKQTVHNHCPIHSLNRLMNTKHPTSLPSSTRLSLFAFGSHRSLRPSSSQGAGWTSEFATPLAAVVVNLETGLLKGLSLEGVEQYPVTSPLILCPHRDVCVRVERPKDGLVELRSSFPLPPQPLPGVHLGPLPPLVSTAGCRLSLRRFRAPAVVRRRVLQVPFKSEDISSSKAVHLPST